MALSDSEIRRLAGDISSGELWDVVSALRGPDFLPLNMDDRTVIREVKQATTGVIRFKLFGYKFGHGDVNFDSKERAELRVKLWEDTKYCGPLWHFLAHAKDAFDALGLNWFEVNEMPEHELAAADVW